MILVKLYLMYCNDLGESSHCIENYLSDAPAGAVDDDVRNMGIMLEDFFDGSGVNIIEALASVLEIEMKSRTFDECQDVFRGFMFLGFLISTALWKFNIPIGKKFANFAREFDRLDNEIPRRVLFERIRSGNNWA